MRAWALTLEMRATQNKPLILLISRQIYSEMEMFYDEIDR